MYPQGESRAFTPAVIQQLTAEERLREIKTIIVQGGRATNPPGRGAFLPWWAMNQILAILDAPLPAPDREERAGAVTVSPDDAERLVLGALTGLPEPGQMRKLLVEEWMKTDAPALRDPETGRLDAALIGTRLGLSRTQMAEILGTASQTVSADPSGEGLQVGLAAIARLLATLDGVLELDHQRVWMNAPRSDLGDRTPLRCIRDGDAVMVVELVEGTLGGKLD